MINNLARIGNFTSSEIGALTKEGKKAGTFGAPALTYIAETNMERRLKRSLTDETNARPVTWGKLLEGFVNDMLGLEYRLCNSETVIHPEIPYWSGSPDCEKDDTIGDVKCPITLKSFCQLVDPLYNGLTGMEAMNEIRENHKDGDKYYWQIVSGAILRNKKFGELIVYMPYQSELPAIKMLAQNVSGELLNKHYWIMMAGDDELPYLLDGGYYKNLNIIRFEIPEADKKHLTSCVLKAGALLDAIAAASPETAPIDENALKV